MATAKELQAESIERFPRGRVLELEQRHASLSVELEELMHLPPAERRTGRPATIRMELTSIETLLDEHALGITRTDVVVYETLFSFLCFAGSGRWFPSWAAIAKAARCCERSVGRALRRLQHHGLLAWVSRSRMQSEGKRGQTSHAYFLDLQRKMAERVYQRFLQLRARRHKRMVAGSDAATPIATPLPPPIDQHAAENRSAIARLGVAIDLRDGHPG